MSTATKVYSDLQSLARMRGRATSEILTIYGLERFVDRLTRTEFRDDFVLKGGILLAAYQLRRPTRDIDMQALDFPLDEAHLRAVVSAVAAVGVDDALVLDTTNATVEDIREDDDYAGYRVRIPARVHTHLFGLNLDVSTGDPIRPAPRRIQLPCLLGGHISIAGHPMETVIAEKSVTILQRGTTSARWRDFVDIRHLARTYPFLAGTLRIAVEAVAQHRQATLRPLAAVTDGYDVIAQNKWRAWRRKNKLDTDCHEDFANQLADVLEFVDPIFTRLVPDESTWDPNAYRWS